MSVFKAVFDNYAKEISIIDENGTTTSSFNGFFEPLRYKNKMYLGGVYTEIGYNSEGYYRLLAPGTVNLSALCDNRPHIRVDGKKYIIDRAEAVFVKNETAYYWAILRTAVEE